MWMTRSQTHDISLESSEWHVQRKPIVEMERIEFFLHHDHIYSLNCCSLLCSLALNSFQNSFVTLFPVWSVSFSYLALLMELYPNIQHEFHKSNSVFIILNIPHILILMSVPKVENYIVQHLRIIVKSVAWIRTVLTFLNLQVVSVTVPVITQKDWSFEGTVPPFTALQ